MKSFTNKFALFCILFFLTSTAAFSAGEQFRSVSSGDWNSTSTWEMSTNGGSIWFAATSTPNDTSGVITIRTPDVVTVSADVSADQLTVNAGATLSINTGIVFTLVDGIGTDFAILPLGTVTGAGTFQTQGTVVMNLRLNSDFNAALKVNTGTTTANDLSSPFDGQLFGPVTVDNGATLSVGNSSYSLELFNNLINNGTIAGTGSSLFIYSGPSFINNNSVTVHNLRFDSTSAISGAGSFTSNAIIVNTPGNVSLASEINFSPITSLSVNDGGILNPNSNILNFNSGKLIVFNGGTVSNSGTFQTQDTVILDLRATSNFNAPLKINDGITTAYSLASPFDGKLYGTVTVDIGAVLSVGNSTYGLEVYNDVTNNGTITGTGGATFYFRGPNFVNNNSITVQNFNFDTTSSISGSGSFTSNAVLITSGGNVSLQSVVTFSPISSFTINNDGILNPNSNIFNFDNGKFVALNGSTVSNSGTFQTQDTVILDLRATSNFNAPLKINDGITTAYSLASPFDGKLYGTVTVDNGAVLSVGNSTYGLEVYNDVTNNGTITGTGGATFYFRGPSLVNNESITVQNLNMDTISSLSGAGSFTSNLITVTSPGNITLASDVTISPVTSLINSGTISTNSYTLIFNSGRFTVNNGASVLNSGQVVTQDTVTLDLKTSSNFNVPLIVSSGITTAHNLSSPYDGKLYGTVTVDNGAILTVGNSSFGLEAYNNVTNNGTIAGTGGAVFRMYGADFTNNGVISTSFFNFQSGAHTLQGTGSWATLGRFLSGSTTTLLSTHQMEDIDIDAGGTFDISSQKLLLSGNGNPITNDGTFTTTGSTVEFNGTGAQTVETTDADYHSLTINNAAGVNLPGAETVPATLTLTEGIFTIGANLTLGNGATIVRQDGSLSSVPTFGANVNVTYIGTNATNSSVEIPAATTVLRNLTIDNTGGVTLTAATTANDTIFLTSGVLTPAGNLTMADPITINRATGTFNTAQAFPANVNVVYSGTTAVNTDVELPANSTDLQNLTVNNPGGVTLFSPITVNVLLNIIKGHLTLNGNIIELGSTASMTETDSNTVNGSTGYIVAVRDLNAPNSENVAGMGAIITTAENMGTTEIRRGHTIQTDDTTQSIERYYDILPANNSGLNATFVFKYDPTELNGSNEDNLVLFRTTNAGTNWMNMGGISNPALNQVTLNFIDAFSRWTAGDSITSLPVELASFTSNVNQREVTLNWSTSQELNNSGFEIERSIVNGQWSKIAFVEGNGTITSVKDYSYTDKRLNSGKYNYRLKQIDYNGNYEYFNLNNEVVISMPEEYKLSQNYPNPFNPTTKIDYSLPVDGKVNISIFDITGRQVSVLVNESQQQAGYYTIQFNASNLTSGTYFYKITADGNGQQFVQTKKMTIIK